MVPQLNTAIPPDFDLRRVKPKALDPLKSEDIIVTASRLQHDPMSEIRDPLPPKLCRNDTNEYMQAESVSRGRKFPCANVHNYDFGDVTFNSRRVPNGRTIGAPDHGAFAVGPTLHIR